MTYDEMPPMVNMMRGYLAEDKAEVVDSYVVWDLQFTSRPHDNPEHDATDAQLGARVRLLLAALEAAKAPVGT